MDDTDPIGTTTLQMPQEEMRRLGYEVVDRIVEHLSAGARPGDLVLIMSNGGFGGIQGKLSRALETRAIVPPVPGNNP